jgi:hypothetical protein
MPASRRLAEFLHMRRARSPHLGMSGSPRAPVVAGGCGVTRAWLVEGVAVGDCTAGGVDAAGASPGLVAYPCDSRLSALELPRPLVWFTAAV